MSQRRVCCLFDVDGTLTPARKEASPAMLELLAKLREKAVVAIVGGSDLDKIREQLGRDIEKRVDFCFAENGCVAYKDGELLREMSIKDELGEANLRRVINSALRFIVENDEDIPIKRGTFVEFRRGMLNVSPIGRNCSYDERVAFEQRDHVNHVRQRMVATMKQELSDLKLNYVIGGMISFDVFPVGWDKTFCLQYLPQDQFDEVHFFGDKTMPGGNDHEIFSHPRTIGHSVTGPDDTARILNQMFFSS